MLYGRLNQGNPAGMPPGEIWELAFGALHPLRSDSGPGIYPLRGDRMYLDVHTYKTKPRAACVFEAHRATIDLQYVIAGGEWIDLQWIDMLTPTGEFNPARDRQDYLRADATASVHLGAGEWAVFFPGEAHCPMVADGRHEGVIKAVVKIPLDFIRPA